MPQGITIESYIGEVFPSIVPKEARRKRVIAMLQASGFTAPGKGHAAHGTSITPLSDLSDAQFHLVHILRCLAMRPAVLVCDEPLVGLEEACRLRVVRMIKRMKQECKTSVLYVSADVGLLRLMSDSLGYFDGGRVAEFGPTEEVLKTPRTLVVNEQLLALRKSGGADIGEEIRERTEALMSDAALGASWLPNAEGNVKKYY